MDMQAAIEIVIADTRQEDPDREASDAEIIDEVRADIDVETMRDITDENGERDWTLIMAYATVVVATDAELSAPTNGAL